MSPFKGRGKIGLKTVKDFPMTMKPTYEELEQVVEVLKKESSQYKKVQAELDSISDALKSSSSGVIITDKRGCIKYANPAFIKMFEYESKKEANGKDIAELFATQGGLKFADIEAIINKSRGETEEFAAVHKDGTIFYVEVSTSSITDSKGLEVGRLASFVDITDRKQTERALKEGSEKIKIFAYSISHDLKSPAMGIYGLTKRLHKNYADILDDKGQKYCEQILKTAEHIAALVEQINVFVSTKETPLTIERLRLKEALQMIREEFSSQLSIRKIRWSEPDYLPEIKADRLAIIRALRNLVDNAIKYGGEVLTEINIKYKALRESHILSITDNGIGLKEQNYDQDVFGTFIRKKTSKGIDGSGLGLSIVREIAEKHGGQVWLKPGLERGITFYISIPKYLQLSL